MYHLLKDDEKSREKVKEILIKQLNLLHEYSKKEDIKSCDICELTNKMIDLCITTNRFR